MDRASGSGVFARDPDALLDMIELDITDDIRKQRKNNAICRLCGAYLERYGQSDKVGQDDLCSQRSALDACMDLLSTRVYNNLLEDVAKLEAREGAVTGWRIEGTLREFPRFPALNVWFEYPVHHVDRSGVLGDIQPEANLPWKKNLAKSGKRNKTPEERKQERTADIEQAFNICQSMVEGDAVSLTDLAEYLNKSEKTVRRYVKENSAFWIDGGNVGRK
jgi:hypothetical protein